MAYPSLTWSFTLFTTLPDESVSLPTTVEEGESLRKLCDWSLLDELNIGTEGDVGWKLNISPNRQESFTNDQLTNAFIWQYSISQHFNNSMFYTSIIHLLMWCTFIWPTCNHKFSNSAENYCIILITIQQKWKNNQSVMPEATKTRENCPYLAPNVDNLSLKASTLMCGVVAPYYQCW